MLMVSVYFDETGHGDDPNTKFLGIVGCGQREEDWIELERNWIARLNLDGLDYFHMKEFTHSKKAFKGWDQDEERRKRLYGDLWKLIHNTEPFVFGCFVKLKDYRSMLNADVHSALVDAYYLCFSRCLGIIINLVFDHRSVRTSNVAPIFDYKKGFMDFGLKIYDKIIEEKPFVKEIVPPPLFRDMRKVRPLQVADIVAYESFKEFEELDKGDNRRDKRWGLLQLEKLISTSMKIKNFEFGDDSSPISLFSNSEMGRIAVAAMHMRMNHNE